MSASRSGSSTTRATPELKLAKNPKNLYILWKEYEFGINGQKPCKNWASNEIKGNPTFSRRPPELKLAKNPKNLYILWKEYEFGINGQKPCKNWASNEIKGNPTFSRRLCFWKAMEQLLKKDYTADTAIDTIYKHYGELLTLNKILLLMRADREAKRTPFFDYLDI